jgi:putative transposase
MKECTASREIFVNRYRKEYPKEHWTRIRTTNVVESPFGTVRLRTDAAKRFRKVQNATAMIWKLLQVAEKSFRTLKGYWLLEDIDGGKEVIDGEAVHEKKIGERMAA